MSNDFEVKFQRILINKSPTADTRTCDWSKVTKEELLRSSESHVTDVQCALNMFADMLHEAGSIHDFTKFTELDQFHEDFATGFKQTTWYDNHRKVERHHLAHEDGVRPDVNLIDVIEYISDCVMAGAARSGIDKIYQPEISEEVLKLAFFNTFNLLKNMVVVSDAKEEN